MNYRFAVTSSLVRTLLGVCFVAFVVATFHCSIEHIPHIYCNVDHDCDQAPYLTCDQTHHSCYDADGGVPNGDMPELAGPDMFCTSSASCSDDAPICAVQRCRACMDSSDDVQCLAHNAKTPRCNAPSGRCVECLASPDCMNPTPVCNTTAFTCRKCAAHSECMSGICKSDGTCAAVAEIAYVNKAGACMDATGYGTQAMPYCEIQYAVNNSSKAFILVSPSATSYATLQFAPTATALGPLTIVGPAGRGAAMKASVFSTVAATPAVLFNTAAVPLTVTLDGLDIAGANGGVASAGVQCGQTGAATATVVIKNSTIHTSGKEGIVSSNCTVTLDGNIIFSNTNEGIKLTSTAYVITNNLIVLNGAAGLPGVSITDSASTGTFAFNTVAQNGGGATLEGGISCPPNNAPKLIEESIVAQNAHNPATNGTQFVGKCLLQSVVTGPDSFTGAIQSVPAFVSMTDFHLDVGAGLTANQACCIDKITAPTTPNVDHDVDRGPRPKVAGTKLDIGAHEAQ